MENKYLIKAPIPSPTKIDINVFKLNQIPYIYHINQVLLFLNILRNNEIFGCINTIRQTSSTPPIQSHTKCCLSVKVDRDTKSPQNSHNLPYEDLRITQDKYNEVETCKLGQVFPGASR